MSLKTVRRIAARIFHSGTTRVVFNDAKKAKEALSADDVRELVKSGAVTLSPEQGIGRGKARFRENRRHAGRGRGPGSRKGSQNATLEQKKRWTARVRALRAYLRNNKHSLTNKDYAHLYRMVKGNAFASVRQLKTQIASIRQKAGETAK